MTEPNMILDAPVSPEAGVPLHHMTDDEFAAHLADKYGVVEPVHQPEAGAVPDTTTSYLAAITMNDTEWAAHQEARFPGTQEVIDARLSLLGEIKAFASPEAPAAKLFEHLSPELAEVEDPIERLKAYEDLCEEHFDFRKGPDGEIRERAEVDAILKKPKEDMEDPALWDLAFEATASEGMSENSHLKDGDELKAIAVLGGTKNGMSNRNKYALEQIDMHGATVESFDYLVAEGNETAWSLEFASEQLGAKVKDEDIVSVEKSEKGIVTTLQPVEVAGRMVPVRIFTAYARDGRNRATTLETAAFWGEYCNAQPDDRMVAVTTDMFVGFQRANAKEVITWNTGTVIDVIGHSAEWAGMKRFANQLLQEYKATVDSKWRTYQKMENTGLVPAE